MSLRRIINWSFLEGQGEITGKIASAFFQYYADSTNWVWACDVDIGSSLTPGRPNSDPSSDGVLRNVPVSSNNFELRYAEIGKSVSLTKTGTGYMITGLSKVSRGFDWYTFVTFDEDIVPGRPSSYRMTVQSALETGTKVRKLTLGELATCGGFGRVPFGAVGRFDAAGTFVSLV